MIKTQMFIGAALFAGVAIGYFAGGHGEAAATAADSSSYVAKKQVADAGDVASVKALRHRIAELERLLAEKSAKSEISISNAVAEAVKNRPPEPPRGNFRERMEELKKNDPARYAQMTNRFAQWRTRRAERARNTMEFLSSIDTSHMSAGAKKTHDELQGLLARREEIEEQLHQEGLSDDRRHQLMGELHSTFREERQLKSDERKNLLDETARNLGFEGEDVTAISATIQEVIEATDSGFGGPHGGHRGGPGVPPPGGAPGGR